MNLLYHKGIYKSSNLKKLGIFKSTYLLLQMTVFGLIMIPVFDIMIKIQTLINVLFMPFGCCKIQNKALNERVRDYTA